MSMTTRFAAILALALAPPLPALAGDAGCKPGPEMRGMRERIASLNEQMDRIEWMSDHAERHNLMDLHMKKMEEGMREIRKRDLGPDCRMEMMGDMMEVMIRHTHAMHAADDRR